MASVISAPGTVLHGRHWSCVRPLPPPKPPAIGQVNSGIGRSESCALSFEDSGRPQHAPQTRWSSSPPQTGWTRHRATVRHQERGKPKLVSVLRSRRRQWAPALPNEASMEYAVKGERSDGRITIVKRGFLSRDEAEDHPIRMSRWKRVWVEEIAPVHQDVASYVRRGRM